MDRINKQQLKDLVSHLNYITDAPIEAYTKGADGRYRSNIGCYVLDWAYGGVALDQIMTDGGGVRNIIGRGTKRETYFAIRTYIDGYRAVEVA
jgi:hypothetical protein